MPLEFRTSCFCPQSARSKPTAQVLCSAYATQKRPLLEAAQRRRSCGRPTSWKTGAARYSPSRGSSAVVPPRRQGDSAGRNAGHRHRCGGSSRRGRQWQESHRTRRTARVLSAGCRSEPEPHRWEADRGPGGAGGSDGARASVEGHERRMGATLHGDHARSQHRYHRLGGRPSALARRDRDRGGTVRAPREMTSR